MDFFRMGDEVMIAWVRELLFADSKGNETEESGGSAQSAAEHFSGDAHEFLEKIHDQLDSLGRNRAAFIVTLAYGLSRVCYADHKLLDVEEKRIEAILASQGLTERDEVQLLMSIVHEEQVLFGASQAYSVTRGLGGLLERREREFIMKLLFEAATADGRLVEAEESELRQINQQLGLDDAHFVDLRIEHRKFRTTDF